MHHKSRLFWQPRFDYLALFENNPIGRKLLVFLNYIIWVFFFVLSFLLIKSDINIFGQLLTATLLAEIIERLVKKKVYWPRPLFLRHHHTPAGLVDSWYKTGSFPSGHTIKASYFFLFCLQHAALNPFLFCLLVTPLLVLRVLVGFHYPLDMFGGAVIGSALWLITHNLNFPFWFNDIISLVFNTVFFIK